MRSVSMLEIPRRKRTRTFAAFAQFNRCKAPKKMDEATGRGRHVPYVLRPRWKLPRLNVFNMLVHNRAIILLYYCIINSTNNAFQEFAVRSIVKNEPPIPLQGPFLSVLQTTESHKKKVVGDYSSERYG